jgi:tetratricopeptide (TPR) repeat protein
MAAIDQCQRVIEHAPGYLPIHRRLAEIYLQQGKLSEAEEKYAVLARAYEVRGEPAQAIQVYRDVLTVTPDDLTVRAHLVDLCQQEGRYEDAIQQLVETAAIHLQMLQVDEAVDVYARALKLAPRTGNAREWGLKLYRAIAEAYASRVDWSRAVAALLQAKKLAPEDEELRRQLADLYMKQGRPDLARVELIGLEPPASAAPFQEDLRADEALERLRVAVRRRPSDPVAHQALAQAYAARGLKREAVAELDTLGELQLSQGLLQDAVKTIEAITNLEPPNVEAYRQLLQQLRQQG